MKKFLPLVLALLMLLSLVACGEKTPAASNEKNEDTQQSEQTTTDPGSEAQTSQPDESTQDTSSGYHFKGYTETADWPGEDCWTSYGLPNLVFDEDVSGTVHISDKDYIYPLNGSDGIMIEARVTTRHLEDLMGILNNSGITLEEDDASINNGYSYYYQNSGTKMKLQLAEWEIDANTYKIQITIITEPTD